jgi:hypothetical protein
MGKILQHTIVLIVLTSFAIGCGGGAEKGANKDLDRPKAPQNVANTKSEK